MRIWRTSCHAPEPEALDWGGRKARVNRRTGKALIREQTNMNARRLFVSALTLSLSGCATSGGGGEEQDTSRVHQAVVATTLQIQLPLEVPLSRLGLVGLTSVTLRNQTSVEGLTLSNASLTVGNEAKTGDLWANGSITVGDRGAVTGDAVARSTVSIPSTTPVSGKSYPNSVFTMQPRMEWSYTLPSSYSADVTANAGETKTASPARYRNITAQGTVKLNAGNYFVDNLTLNSGGKLQIPGDGPAPVIYVFNTLTYQGTITDSNAKGERPVIVYLGTAASTIQTQLDFSLIAPNAAVTLAALNGGTKHRGSVIAKQLELAASAQFAARPSNALVPMLAKDPQACSDMIAADAGLAHPERERQRLSEVARYCMGFGTQCEADLVAKINLDYHLAALQLASGTLSPAQYLAISRDR
ncbi:MAG TPA: hypothetical protein VFQ61_18640, partial [Polyangiaceae bacterium]|nr:hypothetical protein [Polyangiaceae bacterium]